MRSEIIEISPKIAQKWVDSNHGNRNISPRNVEKYVRDMLEGNWSLTHQGIAFYKSGRFADGQHRLHAIIKSGCTVPMMVTFDIDDESAKNIDSMKSRSVLDQLKVSGENWITCDFISAINLMGSMIGRSRAYSSSEILEKSVLFKDSLDFSLRECFPTRKKYLTAAFVFTAVSLAHYNGVDKKRLLEFSSVLISGIVESKADVSAIRLRDWLCSEKGIATGSSYRKEALLKCQRAIKAFIDNEQLTRIITPENLIYKFPDFMYL